MNEINNIVEHITQLNQESQNQRLRLFARVDLDVKLHVAEQQTPIFHKLKEKYRDIDKAVLSFSSHILAINSVLGKLDNVALNASKLCTHNIRSRSKRDKIVKNWATVRTLKLQKNMSFRDIAKYLTKYHKLSVAHSTIFEIWNELEQNIEKQKGEQDGNR